jgi:hypothetical protein
VHIFLIQESMAIDALQAVVEGLTAAVEQMHPDIQIVVVTFSHRIGVHRLLLPEAYNQDGDLDRPTAQSPDDLGATVEYVSFASDGGQGVAFDSMGGGEAEGDKGQRGGRRSGGARGGNGSSSSSSTARAGKSLMQGLRGLQLSGNGNSISASTSNSSSSSSSSSSGSTGAGAEEDIEMIALEAGSADDSSAYRPPVRAPPTLFGGVQGSAPQSSIRDVGPVRPLSSLADLREVALPLGACRASAVAALSNIFDSFYGADDDDDRPECVGRLAQVDCSGDDADHHNKTQAQAHKPSSKGAVPSVMLGPALDAVADWILKPPAPPVAEGQDQAEVGGGRDGGGESRRKDGSTAGKGGAGRAPQGRGLVGVVLNAIFGIGGSLLAGDVAGAARGAGFVNDDEEEGEEAGPDGSPISSCCGCVLHVFVSSPQDLPPGAHDSVSVSEAGSAGHGAGALDPTWVRARAALFASKSLCVHVWAVCSFEGHPLGLSALAPLARLTGGALHHHVLGAYPKDERARLADALTRTLTQQLACRAVMKMRTSGAIQVVGDATGALYPDPDLPQVSRIAACSPDAAFGFQFAYRSEWAAVSPETRGDSVVLQVAFSYETLVESRQVIDYYFDDGAHAQDDDDEDGDDDDGDDEGVSASASVPASATKGLDPYFDSAVDLLDLRQEVAAVKGAALRERERDREARTARRSHAKRRPPRDTWARLSAAPHSVVSRGSSDPSHRSNEWSDSCGYDRTKSLVAVRRLRVITVMVETSPSTLQVIQAADPSTVALLVVREALLDDEARGATPSGSSGQECVHAWVVAALASAANAVAREEQQQQQLSPRLDREGKMKLLRSVADDPPLLGLMQVLCGASDLLRKIAPSASSGTGREAGKGAGTGTGTDSFELFDSRRQLYDADERAQLRSLLLMLDSFTCQKLLYPELMALHLESYTGTDGSSAAAAALTVMHSDAWQLPLRREALTASGAQLFILDAGIDIILYRALGAPASASATTSSSSSYDSRLAPPPPPAAAVAAPNPDLPPAGVSVHTRFAPRGRGLGGGTAAPGVASLNVTPQLGTPMFAQTKATPPVAVENNDQEHDQDQDQGGEAREGTGAAGAGAGANYDLKTVVSDRELLEVVGTLTRNSAWLPAAIHERLSLSPAAMVPRLHSAGAGTSSSEVFTARLVEDHSVYAPTGSTGRRSQKGRQAAGGGFVGGAGAGRYAAGTGAPTSEGSAGVAPGARIGLAQFVASAIDEAVSFC